MALATTASTSHQVMAAISVVVPSLQQQRSSSTNNHQTTTTTTTTVQLLYTVAGSLVHVWDIHQSLQPIYKIGHADNNHNNSSIGTGQALNDQEITCLDVVVVVVSSSVPQHLLATGDTNGSVRLFEVNVHDLLLSSSSRHDGTANTLYGNDPNNNNNNTTSSSSSLWQNSHPLLLQGHTSPIRCLTVTTTHVLSGSQDGVIIVWDIIQECGLFRLLGHVGPIAQLQWVTTTSHSKSTTTTTNYILSAGAGDALIKVWDTQQQCCIQTITKHKQSSSSDTTTTSPLLLPFVLLPPSSTTTAPRLVTGGHHSGHVWSIGHDSNNNNNVTTGTTTTTTSGIPHTTKDDDDPDAICHYMGSVIPPPTIDATSGKISCIQYTLDRRYVGLLSLPAGNSSHVIDLYRILSPVESAKKRSRRLKRRQEKMKKKDQQVDDPTVHSKRRGILDDDDDDDDDGNDNNNNEANAIFDPELRQATDEFEFVTRVNVAAASSSTNNSSSSSSKTKIRSFRFLPTGGTKTKTTTKQQKKNTTELCRIVCANTNNTMETYAILQQQDGDGITVEQVQVLDYYGHTTGIRSMALSSKDQTCCTVSKNHIKIWNVHTRSCIASIPLTVTTAMIGAGMVKNAAAKKRSYYGLCVLFLPGDTHVVIGTREGALLLADIHANEMIYVNETAHTGPIWSIDVKKPAATTTSSMDVSTTTVVLTGSADHQVKFWNVVESNTTNDENDDHPVNASTTMIAKPTLRHTRTLQMTDDVIAVRYSHSTDPSRRMIFVTTLDCTIKVFFDDTLKMFLSLYGHKLPALAIDCSDDDSILASGGADKTIKIWGLDFGDTHRTLHGHTDSITDLRFVRHTHYFFSCSKDNTVRYWDGDRFEQILLLNGHSAEVNCLATSRTGAFVLSAGMDRQVRVWERTKDIVFLEEERERELEQIFDRVNQRDEGGTGRILDRKVNQGDDNDDDDGAINEDEPQSEAAVRKSVTSIACGDRIMEAIERADQEMKDIATFRKSHGPDQKRSPNLMMLSLEPAPYILWVLRTIKSAEIEQSLLLLSFRHIERLMYYLIILLKSGQGIELCSRVAVFLVKAHQNQVRLVFVVSATF